MSSWKLIEDLTLCESWVRTTHDPLTGNEMDKREMWSKITKAFCDVHGKGTELVKVFKVVGNKLTHPLLVGKTQSLMLPVICVV